MMNDDAVVFEQKGSIGLITLNRPKALNALTRTMCIRLRQQLQAWDRDAAITAVVIQGAGDRAFCAGGDVVALYESGKAGTDAWQAFFASEYRMNAVIGAFSKPYIALIDGVVMGGGVGVSVHGRFRIVTERTLFAMPETGIGLIPDVGGGYFMPRLPGESGMFLALTGARLKAADCLKLGIATHYMESTVLPELIAALEGGEDVETCLARFHTAPLDADIAPQLAQIDTHFGHACVEDIVASLKSGDDWAKAKADKLEKLSPTSLKLTFKQMREGAKLDLKAALILEYRIVSHIKAGHDFYEGVRAQLVDKDRNPKWQPARLEDVEDGFIARHFNEAPDWGDLDFSAEDKIEQGDAA